MSFPGYMAFLEKAAEDLDLKSAFERARRNRELASLSVLCAQAIDADPAHLAGIIQKGEEFLNALRLAHEAARRVLETVRGEAATEE
jgi:hypothetical protein